MFKSLSVKESGRGLTEQTSCLESVMDHPTRKEWQIQNIPWVAGRNLMIIGPPYFQQGLQLSRYFLEIQHTWEEVSGVCESSFLTQQVRDPTGTCCLLTEWTRDWYEGLRSFWAQHLENYIFYSQRNKEQIQQKSYLGLPEGKLRPV